MSLFLITAGSVQSLNRKITDNVATTIVDGRQGQRQVAWFQVNENSGGTPSLTVDMTDGVTTVYLGTGGATWRVKAMSADQSVTFNEGYVVPLGWQLRVTSNNASGLIDVVGVVMSVARGTTG